MECLNKRCEFYDDSYIFNCGPPGIPHGCPKRLTTDSAEGAEVTLDCGVSDVAKEKLLAHLKNSFSMDRKTDKEIADLLLDLVWAELDIDSIESAVVNAAIERLRR